MIFKRSSLIPRNDDETRRKRGKKSSDKRNLRRSFRDLPHQRKRKRRDLIYKQGRWHDGKEEWADFSEVYQQEKIEGVRKKKILPEKEITRCS